MIKRFKTSSWGLSGRQKKPKISNNPGQAQGPIQDFELAISNGSEKKTRQPLGSLLESQKGPSQSKLPVGSNIIDRLIVARIFRKIC